MSDAVLARAFGQLGDAVVITCASTSSAEVALPASSYFEVTCEVDCWWRIGPTGVAAAAVSAPSRFMKAGNIVGIHTDETARFVRAIRGAGAAANGALCFARKVRPSEYAISLSA